MEYSGAIRLSKNLYRYPKMGFGDRDLEQALFCKNRIFYKLTAPDGNSGAILLRHLIMHIEAMMRIAGKIGIEI